MKRVRALGIYAVSVWMLMVFGVGDFNFTCPL